MNDPTTCPHDSLDTTQVLIHCNDCGQPLPHLERSDLYDRDDDRDI